MRINSGPPRWTTQLIILIIVFLFAYLIGVAQ